jgi:hypothetical protein
MATFGMAFGSLWLGFRLRYKKIAKNLATAAAIAGILGNIFKSISVWIPSRIIYGIPQTFTLTFVNIILNYISVTFHLIATAIISGFWYITMHNKFKIHISPGIKIVVGVGILFSVIALIPACIFILTGNAVMGIVLMIIPIIYNVIFVLLVTIKLWLLHDENISKLNKSRKEWVVKWLSGLTLSWIMFIASAMLVDYQIDGASPGIRIIQPVSIVISYIGISLCIPGPLDYRFASIRIKDDLITTTSTGSSKSAN